MATPYLGEMRNFGFNFAPKGWALCNGQLLAINQYQALFALLGTTYGGNGIQTFALPNLQAKVGLHLGSAPSGTTYTQGQTGGETTHTLLTSEMPAHNHPAAASSTAATVAAPTGAFPATIANVNGYSSAAPTLPTTLGTGSNPSSGGQTHSNQSPYLVVNVCIALNGIFPSRS